MKIFYLITVIMLAVSTIAGCDRQQAKEEDDMKKEEAIFYCKGFEEEIQSGGFDSFFFNGYGAESDKYMEALKVIKADEIIDLFEQAIARFPDGVPSDSDEYPDEDIDFDDLDEKFYEIDNISILCEEYAKE